MTDTGIRTIEVKLFGGPLDGRLVTVPGTAESYQVGRGVAFWTYVFAGKDGGVTLFAKQPIQRKARKFVMWYIGKHGKSPIVEAQFTKRQPFVYPEGRKVARAKARAARNE